jgi:hypothetical protein
MGLFSTTQNVTCPETVTVNSSFSVPAQLSMTGGRPPAGRGDVAPAGPAVVPPPVVIPEPVVAGGGTSAARNVPVPGAGGEPAGLAVPPADDEESVGAGAASGGVPDWSGEVSRPDEDVGSSADGALCSSRCSGARRRTYAGRTAAARPAVGRSAIASVVAWTVDEGD